MRNLVGYITPNNFDSSQSKLNMSKILGTVGGLGIVYAATRGRDAFRKIQLPAKDEPFIRVKLGHLQSEELDAICTQLKIGIMRRVCSKCGARLSAINIKKI